MYKSNFIRQDEITISYNRHGNNSNNCVARVQTIFPTNNWILYIHVFTFNMISYCKCPIPETLRLALVCTHTHTHA